MMSIQRQYINQYASPECSVQSVTPQQKQQQQQQRRHSENVTRQHKKANNPRKHSRERLEAWKDVLTVMKQQEAKYFYSTKSLNLPTLDSTSRETLWRPIMMQWMYSVVDTFQLVPQVVPTAIYYLDQTLPKLMRDPTDYQLIGLACLELAIKIHDTKMFPMEEMIKVGQATHSTTVQDMVKMEAKLMQALDFQLHPPTSYCFLHQYLQLLSPFAANYLLQPALQRIKEGLLYELPQSPSVLAYAALLVAMEQNQTLTTQEKQQFCVDMVHVTGLSANSPGLANAYQVLASTPVPNSQRPKAAATAHYASHTVANPTVSHSAHNTYVTRPVDSSNLTAATSPASTWCSTTSYSYSFSPSSQVTDVSLSTAPQMPPLTSPASTTTHKKDTMVYSAGNDLGFEVTILDCQINSRPSTTAWSPRNVNGTISPQR